MHVFAFRNCGVSVVFLLMIVHLTMSKDADRIITEEELFRLGLKGQIYDLFKTRWENYYKELYENKSHSEKGHKKRSPINNCLYEEFKRRLDKFTNDLSWEPSKAIKRKLEDESREQKRNTIRNHLYEEYKKRFDRLAHNEPILEHVNLLDNNANAYERIINSFVKAKEIQRDDDNENDVGMILLKDQSAFRDEEDDDSDSKNVVPSPLNQQQNAFGGKEPNEYSYDDDDFPQNEQQPGFSEDSNQEPYPFKEESYEDANEDKRNKFDQSNIRRYIYKFPSIDYEDSEDRSFRRQALNPLQLELNINEPETDDLLRELLADKNEHDNARRSRQELLAFLSNEEDNDDSESTQSHNIDEALRISNYNAKAAQQKFSGYERKTEKSKTSNEDYGNEENKIKPLDEYNKETYVQNQTKIEDDKDNSIKKEDDENSNDDSLDLGNQEDENDDVEEIPSKEMFIQKNENKFNKPFKHFKSHEDVEQVLDTDEPPPKKYKQHKTSNNDESTFYKDMSELDYDNRLNEPNGEDEWEAEEFIRANAQISPNIRNPYERKRKKHIRTRSYGDEAYGMGGFSSASYPAVLTRPYEAGSNAAPLSLTSGNLLANVAQKMNTSTLELAQKITSIKDLNDPAIRGDPQLSQVLQNTIANTVLTANQRLAKQSESEPNPMGTSTPFPCIPTDVPSTPASAPAPVSTTAPETVTPKEHPPAKTEPANDQSQKHIPTEETPDDHLNCDVDGPEVNERIALILNKVLCKLDEIQATRPDEESHSTPEYPKADTTEGTDVKNDKLPPDGTPCNIVGSWTSYVMGMCFDIQLEKRQRRDPVLNISENVHLAVEPLECTPPKKHLIMDTKWNFMGEAMKDLGGPFYLYTHNNPENSIATFVGFCRTCNGMDTIFGSWTFLLPSTDCLDISTAIENKRDILRRNNMEIKRKDRFKEYLFEHSRYAAKNRAKSKRIRIH